MTIKKILVAIGYGKFAPQYFGYAQQLAHYFGASITLVHFFPNPTQSNIPQEYNEDDEYFENKHYQREQENDYQLSETERLKTFALKYGLMEFDHIRVDTLAVEGFEDIEFAQIVEDSNYDLLLLGMRKQRLRERLLGSIVQRVVDNIKIPILLIAPLANIRLVKEIAYATAFDIGTTDIIDYILEWCTAFKANITLVHVSSRHNKIIAQHKLKRLSDQYKKEMQAGFFSTRLLFGNVQNELYEHINKSDTDILIIHNRKKGFWKTISAGNLSLEMTESLNIPLLILPGNPNENIALLS